MFLAQMQLCRSSAVDVCFQVQACDQNNSLLLQAPEWGALYIAWAEALRCDGKANEAQSKFLDGRRACAERQ